MVLENVLTLTLVSNDLVTGSFWKELLWSGTYHTLVSHVCHKPPSKPGMDSPCFMNISVGSQRKTVAWFPEKLEMDADPSNYKDKSSFVQAAKNSV